MGGLVEDHCLKEVARGGDTDIIAEDWGELGKVTEPVTDTGGAFHLLAFSREKKNIESLSRLETHLSSEQKGRHPEFLPDTADSFPGATRQVSPSHHCNPCCADRIQQGDWSEQETPESPSWEGNQVLPPLSGTECVLSLSFPWVRAGAVVPGVVPTDSYFREATLSPALHLSENLPS